MHDVIIIGGSFAGLAAATQLGRARRDVLVLDTRQPRNRFAAHSHGFLSRDGMSPLALLEEARAQCEPYGTVAFSTARATVARRAGDGFELDVDGGESLSARRLILAHGMTDDLSAFPPGAEAVWGQSMFFCPYCHGFEFADQRFGLIWRHGDAVEMARFFGSWTSNFTLFTNGTPLEDATRAALRAEAVPVVEAPITSIVSEGAIVRALDTAEGAHPLDVLFAHPVARLSSDIGPLLGCETKAGGMGDILAVDPMQLTTVPGVFAAGDAAHPMPSISFAVAAGVMAGTAAHRSLLG